jgi:excisionase family DNA binding protein
MSTRSDSRRSEAAHDDGSRGGGPRTANFLLVREAAEIMRMDDSTLYRHLRGGRFPAVKVGGRYLVPAAAVEQMAEEAVVSGRCIVVEQWAVRWREERAAEALARGLTHAPRSPNDRDVGNARSAANVEGRPRPGANQTGAGSPVTQQGVRGEVSA